MEIFHHTHKYKKLENLNLTQNLNQRVDLNQKRGKKRNQKRSIIKAKAINYMIEREMVKVKEINMDHLNIIDQKQFLD